MTKKNKGMFFPWYDETGGAFNKPLQAPRYYPQCNHWREPVRVGRYVITCSSHPSATKVATPPYPDFGMYFASCWKTDLGGGGWTNGVTIKRLADQRYYPALVWDWPDGSTIPVAQMNNLVEICLSKMRHGKRVDIGCIAGHGRTGTFLACLIARVEHLTGKQALETVRGRYCRWAVETHSQEKLIEEYVEAYGIYKGKRRR